MRLLAHFLERLIERGALHVIDADGKTHSFVGSEDGPEVTIQFHEKSLPAKIALNPELAVAEAYMDGSLTVENGGKIYDLVYLQGLNRARFRGFASQRVLQTVWLALRRFQQDNPVLRAISNARHHYDISRELYALFLDERFQYSCAYFRDPENDTLEEAQHAKLNHIAAKLDLKPGMTVAEIGSGWGGLALHLAQTADVKVVGITPSPEQISLARERAEKAGVSDRVKFERLDYREFSGRFDRIVSVGMFEHVGVPNYDAYFRTIFRNLKDDGYALVHAIGRMAPPSTTSPFLRKYVFPGGYSPSMSEVFASTERSRLWVSDVELLRLHYFHTIRHWRMRFDANRDKAVELYDERFCRMWDFYLAGVEMAFLFGPNMVFQMLLSRTRDAVPMTRDFMFDVERGLNIPAVSPDDTVVPLIRPR
ncbi:MAG: cyclopropane-fatty-acyl-phospholipid synthase family protein [Pseudomonadota bacterium]